MTTTEVGQMNIDTEESSSPIDNQFTAILSTLCQFKTQITAISTQMKTLEKTVKREIKQHKKEVIKKQSKGNRKPSGFAVPTKITDQLCEFMNKEKGTMVARTVVTQYIIEYIRQNALQKDGNRKFIKPDVKLATLLDVKDDDEVTYFNIQRYMNKHFVKEKA